MRSRPFVLGSRTMLYVGASCKQARVGFLDPCWQLRSGFALAHFSGARVLVPLSSTADCCTGCGCLPCGASCAAAAGLCRGIPRSTAAGGAFSEESRAAALCRLAGIPETRTRAHLRARIVAPGAVCRSGSAVYVIGFRQHRLSAGCHRFCYGARRLLRPIAGSRLRPRAAVAPGRCLCTCGLFLSSKDSLPTAGRSRRCVLPAGVPSGPTKPPAV